MRARVFSRHAYTLKTTWKELEVDFIKIQSTLGLGVLGLSNNNFG
jgi:hypothetical protein